MRTKSKGTAMAKKKKKKSEALLEQRLLSIRHLSLKLCLYMTGPKGGNGFKLIQEIYWLK